MYIVEITDAKDKVWYRKPGRELTEDRAQAYRYTRHGAAQRAAAKARNWAKDARVLVVMGNALDEQPATHGCVMVRGTVITTTTEQETAE